MVDRCALLRRGLDKGMRVLEVGPSFNPLAPKSEGWDVITVDHTDQAGLIEKYSVHVSVDTSKIEVVDYVWQGGALLDAIPPELHGTFDAVIASHVIEHTTDVVGFLNSAEALTKPDGVIVLAIPDKRVCFDFYRPISTTGEALVAHRAGLGRHDAKAHFDNGVYTAIKGQSPGWFRSDTRPLTFNASIASAFDFMKRAEAAEYIDAHHWVFVPASFELLILELSFLGLVNLRVEQTTMAEATEFFAWLRHGRVERTHDEVQEMRRVLLDRIVVELAEQSRQISGSPLAIAEERIRELDARLATLGENQSR
jgi:SAM-dependent methyltransferase